MQDVRNDYDFPTTICLYSSFLSLSLSLSPISFYYFEEIQKILKYYNEKKEIWHCRIIIPSTWIERAWMLYILVYCDKSTYNEVAFVLARAKIWLPIQHGSVCK